MKNINAYDAEKYFSGDYVAQYGHIFKYGDEYLISLSFEQEPSLNEGSSAADISQYPLEDLLDSFSVYVSDFYTALNDADSQVCFLEFASPDIDDIRNLRMIIGKHVYNAAVEENGEALVTLIIE